MRAFFSIYKQATVIGAAIALIIFSSAVVSGCQFLDRYLVDNYLKDISSKQHGSDQMLLNLGSDLSDLSGDPTKVADAISRLQDERDSVLAARDDIGSTEAPEAAQPLKKHMVELYDQGASLLDDLIATGNYRLASEPLISNYESASKDFSAKMKDAQGKQALVDCVNTYEGSVQATGDKAGQLTPSVLSLRSHTRFVYDLRTLQAGLSETATGLEEDDSGKVKEASAKLAEVDAGSDTLKREMSLERAQDANDYNTRIKRMTDLVQQIRMDQASLHQEYDRK